MQALAVVEIADAPQLLDVHGLESYTALRDEFHGRMKQWPRSDDRWFLLDNDRFCTHFRRLGSRPQLDLAMAKLDRLFADPFELFGSPVDLKVRAGVTMVDDAQRNKKLAVQQASVALTNARDSGAPYQVFDPHATCEVVDESKIIGELEVALERGEFGLHYQPKVHATYGNVVGAEALLRWYKNGSELILPDDFIPIAEQHEIIRPLTWWVVKAAVARAVKWSGNTSVAVNMTPNLLLRDDALTVISDALDLHGLEPQRLTIEVTESVMVDQPELLLEQLAALRGLGVRVSIDDFGTGYSSLAYFRDLPADEIKIDKGFVTPMLHSERDAAIVKTVIELAHNFSLRVVAEGVEDRKTADRLVELGCDILQGYYFDKPLPVEEFEKRSGVVGLS